MSSPSRVCVVTGASYGLGSHIAKQLGKIFLQNSNTENYLLLVMFYSFQRQKAGKLFLWQGLKTSSIRWRKSWLPVYKNLILGEARDWGSWRSSSSSELWYYQPGLSRQAKANSGSKVDIKILILFLMQQVELLTLTETYIKWRRLPVAPGL